MSNVNKPVIPREVADVIEWKRKGRTDFGFPTCSNERLIEAYLRGGSSTSRKLRKIPFDMLMAALINDYDVEKSPEELAEEKRQLAYERIKASYLHKTHTAATYHSIGFADGIKFALNELGVTIPGVNSPETEVNA